MMVKNQLLSIEKEQGKVRQQESCLMRPAVREFLSAEKLKTVKSLFAIVQCFRSRLWSLNRESNT